MEYGDAECLSSRRRYRLYCGVGVLRFHVLAARTLLTITVYELGLKTVRNVYQERIGDALDCAKPLQYC